MQYYIKLLAKAKACFPMLTLKLLHEIGSQMLELE